MSEEQFTELGQFELCPQSIRMIPRHFAEQAKAVIVTKVGRPGQPVKVGMLDPTDVRTRQKISDIIQRPVEAVRLNEYEIKKAIKTGYDGGVVADENTHILKPKPLSSKPSSSEIVDSILITAIEDKASDIHIEVYVDDVDLRLRIDGIMHQRYTDMNPDSVGEIISRIKVMAKMDITERRKPQDGRIRCHLVRAYETAVVDFRVSIVPNAVGEDVVIRVLDSSVSDRKISQIGLDKRSQQTFDQILENPEGLVLVTGPTGSGKTTTLYAALSQMNSGTKKIVTAEDPIEYFLPKVNQKQVSPHMTMAELLKGLLRQDPDVILVGEIRDADTGTTALNAAMTGHMVLSTVHTSDSIGAITRLRGVGLDDSDIAAALLAVIGQRLVRRNCEKCLGQIEFTEAQHQLFGSLLDGIRSGQSKGCIECMHTGYKGRQGIFEFLVVDGGLQDLIAREAHGHEMRRYARQKIGMVTMVEDAISKVHRGFTTLDELTRVLPFRQIRQARDEKAK